MPLNIDSAAYANASHTAVFINTQGQAVRAISEIDTPHLWADVMLWGQTNTIAPYSAPPLPPYTLWVSIIWSFMTDEEAEEFDAHMSVASPLRLRKAFNSAVSVQSETELFGFVFTVLTAAVGAERAGEITRRENALMMRSEE